MQVYKVVFLSHDKTQKWIQVSDVWNGLCVQTENSNTVKNARTLLIKSKDNPKTQCNEVQKFKYICKKSIRKIPLLQASHSLLSEEHVGFSHQAAKELNLPQNLELNWTLNWTLNNSWLLFGVRQGCGPSSWLDGAGPVNN